MTSTIDTVLAPAHNTNTPAQAPFWLRALNWLVERNAAYRAAQKLQAMPDERLDDMGITREQANNIF